jgi:hypothetical protein
MRLIKEYELVTTQGREYDATAYPHDGIFYNPSQSATYFRYTPPNCQSCVMSLVGFRFPEHSSADKASVSLSDIATLLAVAVHRDAAIEQVKK